MEHRTLPRSERQVNRHAPVLNGLRDVALEDRRGSIQIREGSRDAAHPVVGAGRQPEAAAGVHEKPRGRAGQPRVRFELRTTHPRVRRRSLRPEAVSLERAGRMHPIADAGGRLPCSRGRKIDRIDGGDLDRKIEAIDEGPRELPLVAPYLVRRAAAARAWIAVPPAGTPMRCLFAT